jgi:hypothetical protein
MRYRTATLFLSLSLTVVGCSTLRVSDTPRPSGCVTPPPDIASVITQTERLACYGATPITVEAFAVAAGVVDCPGQLDPAWLGCDAQIELYPPAAAAGLPEVLLAARSNGPAMYAVLHPTAEEFRGRLNERTVTVTGHFDDPEAQDCHITSWPDAVPPTPDETIAMCRSQFVITDVQS